MTASVLALDTTDFTSPVVFSATGDGVYTSRRLPLGECTCTDGSCRRCFLDDDAAFERSLDV